MKKLSWILLVAVVGASGMAVAPALAATSAGGVPMCDTSGGNDAGQIFRDASDQLLNSRAFLGRTVQSVDQWNNCIKVIYQDGRGRSVTAFYDPDTLKLVDSMRNG